VLVECSGALSVLEMRAGGELPSCLDRPALFVRSQVDAILSVPNQLRLVWEEWDGAGNVASPNATVVAADAETAVAVSFSAGVVAEGLTDITVSFKPKMPLEPFDSVRIELQGFTSTQGASFILALSGPAGALFHATWLSGCRAYPTLSLMLLADVTISAEESITVTALGGGIRIPAAGVPSSALISVSSNAMAGPRANPTT
jgi:hypothetical protein